MNHPSMAHIEIGAGGLLQINGHSVPLRGIVVEEELGRGASGVVVRGRHVLLDRPVAVKLWLTLRPDDTRDKFRQGMAEARKAASAEARHVVKIHDAGETGGLFYATMEFFDGTPLKAWLRPELLYARERQNKSFDLNLFPRWTFARLLVAALKAAHAVNLLHGDLHTGNILVGTGFRNDKYMPSFYDRDFRIIDFGTSYFSNTQSVQRHWRVLEQTIDELVQPLKMAPLWGRWRPENTDSAHEWHDWFASYLAYLPLLILERQNPLPAALEMKMRLSIDFRRRGQKPLIVTMTQDGRNFIDGLLRSGQLSPEDTKWFTFWDRLTTWTSRGCDDDDESTCILPLEPPG